MRQIIPYGQDELAQEIGVLMRDPNDTLWGAEEKYRAINEAILKWRKRVLIPSFYTLTNGFNTTTTDYELPAYIERPARPQIKSYLYELEYATQASGDEVTYTWEYLHDYDFERNASGNMVLRLGFFPPLRDGRIEYWWPNSALPTAIPVLEDEMTSSSTQASVTGSLRVGNNGVVRIDDEWIEYHGAARSSAGVTVLQNLVRGIYGTTAATHSTGDQVIFGVAMDDEGLLVQLMHQVQSRLHAMWLSHGAAQERDHHSQMMLYYQQEAEKCWRYYTPAFKPQVVMGYGNRL